MLLFICDTTKLQGETPEIQDVLSNAIPKFRINSLPKYKKLCNNECIKKLYLTRC